MIKIDGLNNSEYQKLCEKYNILEILSQSKGTRKCTCGKTYEVKFSDLKRGWGLSCNKSCSASKREKSKPGYNISRVAENNYRRENWNNRFFNEETGNYEERDIIEDGTAYLSECGDKGEW